MKYTLSEYFNEDIGAYGAAKVAWYIEPIILHKWALHCVASIFRYVLPDHKKEVLDLLKYCGKYIHGHGTANELKQLKRAVVKLVDDPKDIVSMAAADAAEIIAYNSYVPADSFVSKLIVCERSAGNIHINAKYYLYKLVSKLPQNITLEVIEGVTTIYKDNKSKRFTYANEIDKEFLSDKERAIKDILE